MDVRRCVVLVAAVAVLMAGTGVGMARAGVSRDVAVATSPEQADTHDPPHVAGTGPKSTRAGFVRAGLAQGTSPSGGRLGVGWIHDAGFGLWYQGVARQLPSDRTHETPFTESRLGVEVDDRIYWLPLTPASVIYNPVTDTYQISSAIEGCEVHLAIAAPTRRTGATTADVRARGGQVSARDTPSTDPRIYVGLDSEWDDGVSVYDQFVEDRHYVGTACGAAIDLPGYVSGGLIASAVSH